MRNTQASFTAEGMALLRAIEAAKPEAVRICYDPLARLLVSPISLTLSTIAVASGLYERLVPGVMAFITVRDRYIDDVLKALLCEGLDQVVILGAGFDTRAYRIPGIEQTQVFEIDHPATQQVKRRRLKQVIDPLPSHVTFLPVDFNTQTLSACLLSSGYNQQGKTLFIWQGVTMYLTPEGIDSTLSCIIRHSGPGSAVIFDYFYAETLRDISRPEMLLLHQTVRLAGEKYVFGIDQRQIEPFLTQRGFREVRDLTAEDLKQLYLTGPNAKRTIFTGCSIVLATH